MNILLFVQEMTLDFCFQPVGLPQIQPYLKTRVAVTGRRYKGRASVSGCLFLHLVTFPPPVNSEAAVTRAR